MFSQAQLPGNRLADSSSSRISSSSAAQSLSPNTTSQHSRTSSPANDYLGLSRKPDYRSQSRDSGSPSLNTSRAVIDITRETILQAFLPHVAVYASADTEELIRLKGIYGGFRGILRPFGEKIPGRIVIRDSVGASRNCENFGIYFVEPGPKSGVHSSYTKGKEPDNGVEASNYSKISSIATSVGTIIPTLDEVVDHYVRNEESFKSVAHGQSYPFSKTTSPREGASPAYLLYLRKLLASRPMVPHETFAQPVACIVAISSQSPAPIETLRDLYNDTRQGIRRVPLWAGNEYLRYYVLIHDEENDDITKSTALFEQMKRHFGLHCHLLRLRSTECLPTDDDSTKLPTCKWLNADEELVHLQWHDQDIDVKDFQQYIFESDAAAIRTFLREMVTQSIVPFMEGRVTTWNDQVASRRRGISGRFMSISKRWTGFGSARGTSTGPTTTPLSSGSNYDVSNGYYPPDTPEATMRRLADYAFMLRDWKLSYSIYDLVRSDFGNDKAWSYYAAANEMAALSLLLIPQVANPKSRENLDHMLDAASYSYLTQCALPDGAMRCLLLSVELLRSRGGSEAEDAAKWAVRLLEMMIMSPLGQNLLIERLAACYKSKLGEGQLQLGICRRKAAFWTLLSSDAWLSLSIPFYASGKLQDARLLYGVHDDTNYDLSFSGMRRFLENLQQGVNQATNDSQDTVGADIAEAKKSPIVDEESEQLDAHAHAHRRTLSGPMLTESSSYQAGGLSSVMHLNVALNNEDDHFV